MIDDSQRILRARAKALAAAPEKVRDPGAVDLVEFTLAHESYAIEASFVRQICTLTELTPVPCTPPFVLGIVNIRGEILSVIDLKTLFDLPAEGLTDLDKLIILHSGPMSFGIVADSVLGVRRTPLTDLQVSLPTLTGIREKYLKGLTRDRVIVLDAAKLIGDEEIIVSEQVEGS